MFKSGFFGGIISSSGYAIVKLRKEQINITGIIINLKIFINFSK